MRFVLVVEGQSEKRSIAVFLKKWLDREINPKMGVDLRSFRGFGEFSTHIQETAREYIDGARSDEIAGVIGLLDLAGPNFYPADVTTAEERIAWGTKHFEDLVGRPRFRMFFAVHELEAWVLGDPDVLPRPVKEHLPVKASKPETVNFDRPPSHLLDQLYQKHCRRAYHKIRDGSKLFGRLDPIQVRARCPHFRELLDTMVAMAKSSEA